MLAGGRGSCAVGLFDKGRHALYNGGGKYPMVLKMLFTKGGGSVKVSTGSVQIKKSARNQPCQPGSFQGQMEEWQHLSGGIKDS